MNSISIKIAECIKCFANKFCNFNLGPDIIDNNINTHISNYINNNIVQEHCKIIKLQSYMSENNINYKKNKLQIFHILSQLTNAPIINNETFNDILNSQNDRNLTFAYINNSNILGLITIIIEQKFIHGGLCVAHIEDVVVDQNYRNNNIGSSLIKFALEYAKLFNCYKVILDCNKNVCVL